MKEIKKMDVIDLTKNIEESWKNFPICGINDQVVRLSVLQKDFYWHKHDESDEFFYVIDGELFVDFRTHTETLTKGQMIKVPKGVEHRTRSKKRTTILCFESADNDVSVD